ncbi:exodeoxyribonuclease VII large subunit [Winkia neuii]|uniref:exodeoxyribonuclease VII large subunit n=1 Tax=Winkia TaxID=2692118 RepID=UPI00142F64DF|nr:exodeoxyribonuclease VII large subunit [Winkia sp. UMB1295B]MDK7185222.1 exodeoxyribonuclease VII large subunit [Winkia sp. UMB1295B]NJJ15848.1 exodeoxyribonuclease VII large subunit [Winkia neuii]
MNANSNLAPRASLTTRDNPWPLALLSTNIKKYVDRMSALWVEGQVVEYKRRPGTRMAFFTIRDLHQNVSMTVKAFARVVDKAGPGFDEGARVVVNAKPDYYEVNGSLSLFAHEIHTSGLGDLLAQIEMLRKRLAAEGLFASERKKPLPFLPRVVGLICGRNAKAKHDVIVNAQARWPSTRFEIREVAVQGERCVPEVSAALAELDQLAQVDVIVIARGGGSVEDLLPFSDEAIVRAAANATTPLVSAIGHETDAPLLDLVSDYRASTPTDAARKIVPDVAEQEVLLTDARTRMQHLLRQRIDTELTGLSNLRARPVMSRPSAMFDVEAERLSGARERLRLRTRSLVDMAQGQVDSARQTLRALSPQGILERGFSVLRGPSGQIITSASQIKKGDLLEGLLAEGRMVTQVVGATLPTKKEEND